jgi:hypothetical protein
MRQHMKAKTNNVKARKEAPTTHQLLIATRIAAGKKKQADMKAAAADRKAARQLLATTVGTVGSKDERFADRASRRSAKWAHLGYE